MAQPAVERLTASAYAIPTEQPESDGTLAWDTTTIIVVEAEGGGRCGLGYTYGAAAVRRLVADKLAGVVRGIAAMQPPAAWRAMQRALRNDGRPGMGATAIAAVDTALWDLKARLLDLPLADVLPRFHDAVPIYGSGGFTSYTPHELEAQLCRWAAAGLPAVKMKVGREPAADAARVALARRAVGDDVGLMVDANGAYGRKEALALAQRFAEQGVEWLEEPVSSEDTAGLRLLRDRAPAGMAVAAGEYTWLLGDALRLLEAGAVDTLQADATRCGGITNLLRIDGLCKAYQVPFSGHCAPQLHAHVGCAMETLQHVEYFFDHARIEALLFEGALEPAGGHLRPDAARPGLGIELRRAEAERYGI